MKEPTKASGHLVDPGEGPIEEVARDPKRRRQIKAAFADNEERAMWEEFSALNEMDRFLCFQALALCLPVETRERLANDPHDLIKRFIDFHVAAAVYLRDYGERTYGAGSGSAERPKYRMKRDAANKFAIAIARAMPHLTQSDIAKIVSTFVDRHDWTNDASDSLREPVRQALKAAKVPTGATMFGKDARKR